MKKIISLLALVCVSGIANATQPIFNQIAMQTEVQKNLIILHVKNYNQKQPVVVDFSPGQHSTVKFSQTRVQIPANGEQSIKIEQVNLEEGRHVLHIQSHVAVGQLERSKGPELHEVLISSQNQVRKVDYEEGFLKRREAIQKAESEKPKMDLGGFVDVRPINLLAFKAGQVPSGVQFENVQFKHPYEYSKMQLRQLPKDSEPKQGGKRGEPNEPNIPGEFRPVPPPNELEQPSANPQADLAPYVPAHIEGVYIDNRYMSQPELASLLTVKGHMSLKVSASQFKAAWGWVVRAWQLRSGSWHFLGWTYVGGDGAWQISFDSSAVDTHLPVRVEYQTKNRFVSLQDSSGNPYTWGDNWNLAGATIDIGYRYADLTVNGDLPGVDKLYVGATNVWVKFYNNGMNALRDQPIEVTFPNTLASGKCVYNDGAGPYAWSCSYWGDGKIYIIPAHAAESVVQHEIGHSINSFYWNGNMPAGSGGSHSMYGCYNQGLALTEGWANFLAYWVEFDSNATNPVAPYFNVNIESLPSGVCSGPTNEMRVAATFWDMYDYWNDGPNSATSFDSLLYTNPATPVSIYLNNKRNGMTDYLDVVKAGQSAYWQGEFTKLFRLNTIIP